VVGCFHAFFVPRGAFAVLILNCFPACPAPRCAPICHLLHISLELPSLIGAISPTRIRFSVGASAVVAGHAQRPPAETATTAGNVKCDDNSGDPFVSQGSPETLANLESPLRPLSSPSWKDGGTGGFSLFPPSPTAPSSPVEESILLPALELPLLPLLSMLDTKNIILLWTAALSERRILFHSQHVRWECEILVCSLNVLFKTYENVINNFCSCHFLSQIWRLHPAAMGLASLLYPLQWPHPFIPVLPRALEEYIQVLRLDALIREGELDHSDC
jgi:hypothetical protein